jgi:hypothetical protein
LLSESNLLNELEQLFPNGEYSIYGVPAYPQSGVLLGGYRRPRGGSYEARYNTNMSKVRICVEWGFKEMTTQFRLMDFKIAQKIFKSAL